MIYEIYLKLQREANGDKKVRAVAHRNIEVFRFVLGRANVSHINRSEHLARLTLPPWPSLREAWDKEQKGTRWEYGSEKAWQFPRDFKRGQEVIVGTSKGLLGEPGEPRTDEERRRRHEELSKRLPPSLATHTHLNTTD